MKTKVNDLTDEQLDALVPIAQGWKVISISDIFTGKEDAWVGGNTAIPVKGYEPTANYAQAMDLAIAFKLTVNFAQNKAWNEELPFCYEGDSARVAICKAVVASVFGDEVEVSN